MRATDAQDVLIDRAPLPRTGDLMRLSTTVSTVRTTVSVCEELLEDARRRASSTGQTSGIVLESALRRDRSAATAPERPQVPVLRGGSGPLPGLDLTFHVPLTEQR